MEGANELSDNDVITVEMIESYERSEITIEEAVKFIEGIAKESSDELRISFVRDITELYYHKHGKPVKETMLERLANVLLVADLRAVHKPKRDYPFMSDRKQKRIEEEHENNFASFDYFDEKGVERTPSSIAGTSGRFTGGNTFYHS